MKSIVCIRYMYLIGSLLLFGNSTISAQSLNSTRSEGDKNLKIYKCKKSETSQTVKIPTSTLGVKGELFEEGYYYYFDSFEVLSNNQLVVAGINRESGNFLKVVDMENNSLLATIPIQDDPVEILEDNGKIIIYGKTSMMSIDENYHLTSKPHSIRHYATYSKMLMLGDDLYIYMGDGSAFRVDNLDLIALDKIQFQNQDIWIQKINPKTFDVTVGSEKFNFQSDSSLGAMTILGENNGNLIFVTDVITHEVPLEVVRRVSSPSDGFTRNELFETINPHSYLKNDLKYKDGKLYTVSIDEQNITVTTKEFTL